MGLLILLFGKIAVTQRNKTTQCHHDGLEKTLTAVHCLRNKLQQLQHAIIAKVYCYLHSPG